MSAILLGVLAAFALLLVAPRLYAWLSVGLGLRREAQALRSGRTRRAVDRARVRAFHDALPTGERAHDVDARTWRDLDMDDVFEKLDHTRSAPGQQFLHHLLRMQQRAPRELQRLEAATRRMSVNDDVVSTVRAALDRLDDPRALELRNLFQGELPPRPVWWWIFPTLTIASVASLALSALWPRSVIALLVVCAVNIIVQLLYKPRVRLFTPAFHTIPALLRVARSLGDIGVAEFAEQSRALQEGERQLGVLRMATKWLLFEPVGDADASLASSLYEYANLLLLLDVNAFMLGVETVRAHRHTLRAMFDAIGFIDAASSVALWRAARPHWCVPEFTPEHKAMHVEGVVHPLLDDAVPNSVDVDGRSLLISGSNMSGKTTFLRALGVNGILVSALHTACATRWQAPLLAVGASIGREDSVMEGRSYYLAEVESVRRLLREKERGRQYLFLLDELYRGTNTPERVAAAYGTLRYLDRGTDIVMVATHDLEILDLLDGSYAPYHFREEIHGGALSFDFRIRPGPASTRNAIALLQLMEYPDDVVRDALRVLASVPPPP